jgi:hypothetical protein
VASLRAIGCESASICSDRATPFDLKSVHTLIALCVSWAQPLCMRETVLCEHARGDAARDGPALRRWIAAPPTVSPAGHRRPRKAEPLQPCIRIAYHTPHSPALGSYVTPERIAKSKTLLSKLEKLHKLGGSPAAPCAACAALSAWPTDRSARLAPIGLCDSRQCN